MDTHDVKEILAERRMFSRVQKICDEQDLPYPPDLCVYLEKVQRYRHVN